MTIFISKFNHSVAENSLFRLCKNLPKNIYKVSVICLNCYFYEKELKKNNKKLEKFSFSKNIKKYSKYLKTFNKKKV